MTSRLITTVVLFLFGSALSGVGADGLAGPDYPSADYASLKPSLAVVIGILTIMFALTFLLLVYAKFCHGPRSSRETNNRGGRQNPAAITAGSSERFSGLDKAVIESLPYFRFSALKGSREGLECAVCLSKFEDVEILRLLPKCRHAFHIDCIDRWLEKHSSCPLCRRIVGSDDLKLAAYSTSLRMLEDCSGAEIFVRREESNRRGGSFSVGTTSFRSKIESDNRDEAKEEEETSSLDRKDQFHKHNHQIVVSDNHRFVFKNRWSDVTSSDLVLLSSEMMLANGGGGGAAADVFGSAARKSTDRSGQQRSASEITAVSRNRIEGDDASEERVRRVWLPIARRTIQWFVNRRQNQLQKQKQSLDV